MKSLFLDLDGTLIDVSERYFRVYSDFMKQANTPFLLKSEFWRMMRKKEKIENLVKKKYLASEYKKFFLKNIENSRYLKYDYLFEFTIPTLKYLRKLGVELFMVTLRRNRVNLLREIKRFGLNKFFEGVLTAQPHSDSGKNYEIKKRLIKKTASKGDIVVGDSKADILSGKILGLQTVVVTSGIRNYHFIKQFNPDYIFRDMRSLKKLKSLK